VLGLTAWHRRDRIFAVLPKTSGMDSPSFPRIRAADRKPRLLARIRGDSHIAFTEMQKVQWFTFELTCDADLNDAIEWLGRAYEARR